MKPADAWAISLALWLTAANLGNALAAYLQRPSAPVTFPACALVKRGGQVQTIPVWVRALPCPDRARQGFYSAYAWDRYPLPGARQLDHDAHYRTYYPLALLPGPGGEDGVVVDLPQQERRPDASK
jgi:hypothetical protein